MKCPSCGKQNKKDSTNCKACNTPLVEKVEMDEVTDETIVVSEEIRKEIEKKMQPKKKKKNIFKRIWLFIKLIIVLSVIALISLTVYVYSFFDYEKYFNENVERYYKTENAQYIDNMKLFFRVYKYNDKKVSEIQSNTYDQVNVWINELKEKEYKNPKEKLSELDSLKTIIDDLFIKTDVEGHTALTKKDHSSLEYAIEDLKEMYDPIETPSKEDNEKEEEKPSKETTKEETEEEKEYDVSEFKELSVKQSLKLFEDTQVSLIYIGRETCIHCVEFIPSLKEVQKKYDFKFNYIDLTKIDFDSDDYKKFYDKLDIKYEMNGEKNEFKEYMGYTPMLIIIKNGRMVDGHIGYLDAEGLDDLVSSYVK